MTVRVRFAPSPTGSLHVGNALDAVANRAYADAHGGQLVLRLDDTDATRVVGGKSVTVAGQDWIFPSESQCLSCHTQAAGGTLGLETAQLNGDLLYPTTGKIANQDRKSVV